jgi:hypothetical protein
VASAIQNLIPEKAEPEEKTEEEEDEIKKAMNQYYGKKEPEVMEPQLPLDEEDDLPVISLDDLEDDNELKKLENTPAWFRKFKK